MDAHGTLRDLSGVMGDWTPQALECDELRRIAALEMQGLPALDPGVRLGIPVKGIGKFIAIGMNYTDFAADAGQAHPQGTDRSSPRRLVVSPVPRTPSCCPGGRLTRTGRLSSACRHGSHRAVCRTRMTPSTLVAGYCLVNDLSEREFQNDRGGTWDKGKGCDTFGPVGPWVVTSRRDGESPRMSTYGSKSMVRALPKRSYANHDILPLRELIAYVSQFMTLEPGDILTTGTPAGVGMALKPSPVFLKADDVMRLGSSKLGIQQHRVESWRQTLNHDNFDSRRVDQVRRCHGEHVNPSDTSDVVGDYCRADESRR